MSNPKKQLEIIKSFLEQYQEDLLKIKHRSGAEVVRMRCNISESLNHINMALGNLPEVLTFEFTNQYVGMKLTDLEKYKEKTNTEICESLETQLCTTDLPPYILNPLISGIWEIKKRDGK